MTDHLAPETIVDYLHHELTPAGDALAYAHLSQCDVCTSELEAERTLSDALRAAAVREELELPSTVKAAIWQNVRNERPAAPWWESFLRPAFAVPVAAAVVIGAVLSVPAIQQSTGPRIGASYYLQQHAASRSNPLTDSGPPPSVLLEESSTLPSASFASFVRAADPRDPAGE